MDRSSNLSIENKPLIKTADTVKEKQDAMAIRTSVFVEEQNVPKELEYDQFDKLESTVHLIAYLNGQPIGAARFRPYSPGIAKAERVAVSLAGRGTGIGSMLMKALEQKAKELGYHKVKLHAQLHAEPFYRKLGYKRIGDIFMEADIEHITMEKGLDS